MGTVAGISGPAPFPWEDVMAFGLGFLRLPPAHFWAMTPRELDAAMRGVFGAPSAARAPSRSVLDVLIRRFPDDALALGKG